MNFIEAPQYSIWWVPSGELFEQLQNAADVLGREFKAQQYQAETFVPHITVVPDIKTENLEALVNDLKLFTQSLTTAVIFELGEIDRGGTYFQCVFAKANENPLMLETVKGARNRFRPELLTQPFLPHMSLLYGDYPQEVRAQAAERARNLVQLPQTFRGDKISLWTSGVPARDWQMVAEFSLIGS